MKFSERMGITPVSTVLQIDSMNDDLRNSLWNILNAFIWGESGHYRGRFGPSAGKIYDFWEYSYLHHLKLPTDTLSKSQAYQLLKEIKDYYFDLKWFEVYNFLEFIIDMPFDYKMDETINGVLKRELAGYRIIDCHFVPITDEIEVEAVQQALDETPFSGVTSHLKQALKSLSDRENPDHRNSIKESISAVESMARELTGKPKATLGDALNLLEKDKALHPALKTGFSALYGYTSDEGGIRHAMQNDPNLSVTDAKYFLITCSAFINYLKVKIDQS